MFAYPNKNRIKTGFFCVLYIFPHYEVGIILWNSENDDNALLV
jgi:hypothetical protein